MSAEGPVEIVPGDDGAPAFLTCEHASQRMPGPYALVGPDARLVDSHWAYDPGARELTLELAQALRAPAVLARFGRLVIDPNRTLDSPTLFRDLADGEPIHLNRVVTEADRKSRIAAFYEPYHRAIDDGLRRCSAPLVFPLHTFTEDYEGSLRPMEVGVLFDTEDELGHALHETLTAAGFVSALNEPWSGKDGLIHSADHHARAFGRRALEIEVRNDRATDPAFRARLIPVVAHFLREAADRLRAATPSR